MAPRVAFLLALLSATGAAQFSGLSSTYDGSSLYFVSTLRLRGKQEPRNGKVFVATKDGVRLFRAHEPEAVAPDTRPCGVSGFRDYAGAEVAANGAVALQYSANTYGGCSYPINTAMSQLVTPTGETAVQGVTRLSSNGRYALNLLALTARPWDSFTVSLLDLQTGVKTTLKAPTISFPDSRALPYAGRGVADDGTAIIGVMTAGNYAGRGYLLRPGADPLPVPAGIPIAIDAAAAHLLYQNPDGVSILDLRTNQAMLLVAASATAFNFRISDDARRMAYIRDNQVHVMDTASVVDRTLTSDAAGISDLAISGDGKVVHAVTRVGRLLKIDVDSGTTVEWIGRTPFLGGMAAGILQPGLAVTLAGGGLADGAYDNHPPYPAWAGTLTMWIGERKVPVISLKPDAVTFLVPWDIQTDNGTIRIQAEVAGEHTPFYYPEFETTLYPGIGPQAGAVTRANWEQFYVGPVNPGEIIHVFALGFGPVSPEVADGATAPAAEPFARLAQPLTCSNLDVLYAGLMPYTVQRIYQLDLRIGPKTGYQQFTCTLGNSQPFIFLTLNVVP